MTAALDYSAFLDAKAHSSNLYGFTPSALPGFLFDFQAALVAWALRKGRGGLFADCGLGKTPMELAWADAIVRRENRHVLLLTPLAVAPQVIREAEKFGIPAVHVADGRLPTGATIIVANYERLHLFDAADFVGLACEACNASKGAG